MNGLFAYHTNQSNLNRFITVSNWNEKDINKIKIKMINQVENGGVVVIDDTITKKYGKEMFGTDWHYDHTKGKDVWGIQIADCVLSGRGIHPLLSTVYIRNNSRWLNDHTKFKTKIEIQKTHLTELVDMGLKFSTVVMDIWYFCKELTDHIESLHKDWTAQCKSNRLVLYDGKWIDLRTFANIMMEKEEFKIAQIGEDQYLVKVFTVIMKSIGEVRLLISHNKHFEYKFYVSNRLNWNEKSMIELYVKRWGVEVWRKERKAHYGLKDCLLRSDERVSKYLTLSTLSDNLLEIATMLSPVYASLTKQGCTPELKHRWIAIELIGQLITSARRINDNEVRKIVEGLLHPYKSTIYGYK